MDQLEETSRGCICQKSKTDGEARCPAAASVCGMNWEFGVAWRGAWEPAKGGARVAGLHVLNAWSGWGQRAGESAAARSPERRNRGSRWAGTHGGGDRRRWSRAPVELEVEESRWGLIGKNKKVQGLHYKIKFTTDLGLN